MQILITFKQSEKWLFNEIRRHSNKSGFVKDAVTEYLGKRKTDPNEVEPVENKKCQE